MIKIPLKKPTASEAALFEQLVLMVQLAKREPSLRDRLLDSTATKWQRLDVEAAFLEELIDACVLELYFPEEAAAKDLQFMDQVSVLLNVDAASCRIAPAKSAARSTATKLEASSTIERIKTFVATANDPSHPLRNQLLRLPASSPELFAVIKQEGLC